MAVAAVVGYHMAPGGLPGGFFGVDVFFVISGYLITSLLSEEWAKRGGIDLVSFWMRRARRLYPAMLILLVVFVVVGAVVAPEAVALSRTTIPAALVYMTNWWFILRPVPYFQAAGRPPLFIHFWSLAIEEQYYLTWPPVLLILLSRWRRPARIGLAVLAAAAGATILMAVLYGSGTDTGRLYYGSDTHSQGLLVGSALGLLVPPRRLSARVSEAGRRCLDSAGAVALTAIVAMMVLVRQTSGFTWRGGLLLVVVLAGVATVVAAHPATRLSGLLAVAPLRWLGTRSYSVYLWHWPILDLTRPHVDVGIGGAPLVAVRLALIAAAAELSFRFVEQPWRRGRAQAWLRVFLRHRRHRQYSWAAMTCAFVAFQVVLASVSAPRRPPELRITATAAARLPIPTGATLPPSSTSSPTTAAGPTSAVPTPATTLPPSTAPRSSTTTTTTRTTTTATGAGGDAPGAPTPVLRRVPTPGPILAIGDSVMLAAADGLDAAFGSSVTVDAAVGRQVDEGLDRLERYRAAGRLAGLRALVIGLGSNGPFEPGQMQRLAAMTRGVPEVVLVNVRVPRSWQSETNATIDGAARRPGFTVADWFAASAGPGLLYPDAIHPDRAGQLVYADLVSRAVGGRAGPPGGNGRQLSTGATR